ncbi:predicted protein [Sclerotinia sclerotiorum 1980 UF-70]|uniref:F-box domain-containing protein n=2 Tax=Sclerotinia sclerotiorum (strain ATCC 18683 / 1980 / Ss-1) TaxID=665079 RepID=A7F0V6_SCLS1|nr:predicted protein [Sclerotinia sclerotiorum 1980 UF-70]APA13972.1 hypothetical protein sscle_12g087420 [Sclerotinia sclerotiorum 1980 UF-70]EDN95348.1 predicted protein [Sclerotinia sclerotiorum 1980 UF-70]
MSASPTVSFATSDVEIDLAAMFEDSIDIARDVVKGVILKHCNAPLDGQNICFAAQHILAGDDRYNRVLTMRESDSSADTMVQSNIVQLPYSGNTIGPTFHPSTMGQMAQMTQTNSPLTMSNINSHLHRENSMQNPNNSQFRPQSSFSVAQTQSRAQTELLQVSNLLQGGNNYHQQTYPSNNNLHSLSSIRRPHQLPQVSCSIKYPHSMGDLFSRSDSILASQNINPTNRSKFQRQMISELQDSQNLANPHNPNSSTAHVGQGSSSTLERSSSNGSLSSNLSLPPLAPAQRSPHTDSLLIVESRSTTQSRAETPLDLEMAKNTNSKKRRAQTGDRKATAKKAKTSKGEKADKLELMKDKAKYNLPGTIWMRILEFCPPIFLRKARFVSKEWKSWVEDFSSIHVNCRKENFGFNLPEHIPGLSAKQYVDLLGGKGCMEPGCKNKDASRTHWAWKKRWCLSCWKEKIEREDRIQKHRQLQYTRPVIDKLLECIPVSMYDSFGKPHDYVEDGPQALTNQLATHRLYKYYLIVDVDNIIKEYEALTPEPFREDPTHDAQQKATARQIWEDKMAKLDEERDKFFEAKKAENDKLMQLVIQIEAAIRERRAKGRKPNDANRESRRTLFLNLAKRDLPEVPEEFIINTKAFKAAVRIFRDGGSERGWRTLKPKIEGEYASSKKKDQQAPNPATNTPCRSSGQDIQMTGHDLGNFELDNDDFHQLGHGGLQQNLQQTQLQGFQLQKSTAFTSNKSLGMNHSGGSLGFRTNSMATGSRSANNPAAAFLSGGSIFVNQPFGNSASALPMVMNSMGNGSFSNNGSSASSLNNVSHMNNDFSTNSLAPLSQINNGSSVGSSNNLPRGSNGFSNGSMTALSQNNNGRSMGSSSNTSFGNINFMPHRSQNINGTSIRSSNNISFGNNSFTTGSLNQISQSNNGSSVNPSSNLASYNNAFNSGSLTHFAQNNSGSSLVPSHSLNYASQNGNAFSANSSSHLSQTNNSSSLVPGNPSNVGSSSTPRSAMAISSIITGTQPQSN